MFPWLSAAETARRIRPVLRRAFPDVRFTVRSSTYAGGSAIDVAWTDGPTAFRVDDLLDGFNGTRYNDAGDFAHRSDSWHCPEHGAIAATRIEERGGLASEPACCPVATVVHFAPTVFTTRRVSREFEAELGAQVAAEYGMPAYDPHAQPCLPHRLDTARDLVVALSLTTAREGNDR